jgi:hypothetical protein
MNSDLPKQQLQAFLRHQTLWAYGLMLGWFGINVMVLATTQLMEYRRDGKGLAIWEPFCWELSSAIMLLALIPVALYIHDRWLDKLRLSHKLAFHALLSLPFSVAHVTGMVALRHLSYWLMNSHYNFGNLGMEFLYEYRKDAQAYLTLALVIFGYRLLVRRLQGEASYLSEGEESSSTEPESPPERLLIKKLGREFLIQTRAIEWIEASGNYANLHIKDSVYPMRVTMEKLQQLLPDNFTRVHRSNIVNLECIKEIQLLDSGDHQITLHNGHQLTLSRRYRENFKSLHSLG